MLWPSILPFAGGGGWNFDDYYAKLKNAGVTVAPAIKGSVDWLSKDRNHKPVAQGEDAASPSSYKAHADHLFQFAARYGSTKVAMTSSSWHRVSRA
jgi:hypothetical protein